MEHISSTPFNDTMNDLAVELPEVILQYIDNKFPSIQNIQDKSLLQTASRRFWETLVMNCIPTLRTYIDDVTSSFSKKSTTTGYSNEPPITSLIVSSGTTELPAPKLIHDLDLAMNTLLSNDFLDLKKNSTCSTPSLGQSSKTLFELLLQDLTDHQALIDSTNCAVLFPKSLPTFEDIFKIEKTCIVNTIEQLNAFEVLQDYVTSDHKVTVLQTTKQNAWLNEKFSETQFKFVSNDQRYKGSKLYCLQEETELNPATLTTITITSSQPSSSNIPIQSSNTFAVAASTSAVIQQDYPCEIPSFSAITDALDSDPSRQTADFYPKPSSSALVPNTNFHSLPRNSHGKSPFMYSNSTNRSFQNISPQAANIFGTPIADPLMYHLLENFEAECYKKDKAAAEVRLFEKFHSATDVQKSYMVPSKQLVFSTPNQVEFFKMMNSVLPHLNISERIFQIDEVWVDQKTLTVSMKPGGWLNPHTVDCYSKMLNTEQLIRGRQGLIRSSDVISHIVGREDMELLMRPLLNHSDPICRDMLSEQTVGFSLQNANFVHLPCFNDKQWIVITANLSTRRFFDIMNPDGSGNDKFTTIISSVTFNFKCLFARTYPNCTSFNIKDFDYRFVPVPRTHFRYDTGIFLLQILKTYRGMGVPGFSTYDLQALREIFLYEIATCCNSQIQLPIVKSFLQNHGYRLFN